MVELIIVVGFVGSGKNTVGDRLVEKWGYSPMSFADSLKDCLSSIFCWDREALSGTTPESRAWREEVDPWWADRLSIPHFTPRWAMRNFGTEVMRQHFNNDIWILNVERRIAEANGPIVITDGRFPNEIDLVHRLNGRSIRVRRGNEPSWWEVARLANTGASLDDNLLRESKETGLSTEDVISGVQQGITRVTPQDFARMKMSRLGIHESEWAWIGHRMHFEIKNDGSIDDLNEKIDELAAGAN